MGGSKPKAPPKPPPPVAAVTKENDDVKQATEKERRRVKGAQGRQSTQLLSSSYGQDDKKDTLG